MVLIKRRLFNRISDNYLSQFKRKISIQLGDGKLLNQLTKKNIIFDLEKMIY